MLDLEKCKDEFLKYTEKYNLSFLGFNIKTITANVLPNTKVVPLGDLAGLKLYTKGILVVGVSEIKGYDNKVYKPYEEAGIEQGDTILKINSEDVNTTEELVSCVSKYKGNKMNITYMKNGETFEWLDSKHGLVLGAMENIPYKEHCVSLKCNDFQIYLYTDGVTEAHNDKEELFNEDRLIELINNNNLNSIEFIDYLNGELDKFKGSQEQFDDITMMIFEYKIGEDENGNN